MKPLVNAKQRVDARFKNFRKHRQQQNVGHGRSALPFGDGLCRYPDQTCQLLLRHIAFTAQGCDLFSDIDHGFSLFS